MSSNRNLNNTFNDMDDFGFFLKLAKPLVFNLPDAKDRTLAARWLKKLSDVNARESDPASDKIHVEYLKLLLFVMQGDRLTGIFEEPPPEGSLHDLLEPGQRKATEMISLVKRRKTSATDSRSKISAGYPRVVTSVGGDLCEYVAVQEIPNFGIHGYYALSTEPLTKWTNPRSSAKPEMHISAPSFLDNVHDNAEAITHGSAEDSELDEMKTLKTGNESTIIADESDAATSDKECTKNTRERTRHSEKSLRKIFQAQRSEVAGVETRPCWGRSRYIDRLIDESPHLVGDLDAAEADALLHLYRDRKLMKFTKGERNEAENTACTISSRRRQVEARLDLPPCAPVLVEETEIAAKKDSRTCFPRKIESDCMDEVRRGNYSRCCLSDNDEFYPTNFAGNSRRRDNSDFYYDYDDSADSRSRAHDWRDFAYEIEDGDTDLDTMLGTEEPGFRTPKAMTTSNASDKTLLDEVQRLVTDPARRGPPSTGKVKVPRKKVHLQVVAEHQRNREEESWELPAGHSTEVED